MCEMCAAKTEMYFPLPKENENPPILGKYFLVRATEHGSMMDPGDWGLVISNDPEFVFKTTPWPNPFFEHTPEEMNNLPKELAEIDDAWFDDVEKFGQELIQSVSKSHWGLAAIAQLVELSKAQGLKEAHFVAKWLFQYIGELLSSYPTPLKDDEEIPPVLFEQKNIEK